MKPGSVERWGVSLLVVSLVYVAPTHAYMRYGGWDANFGGSFKTIFSHQNLRQNGIYKKDHIPGAEQRLRLTGTASWKGFRFEVADELSLLTKSSNQPLLPLPESNTKPAWDTSTELADNRDFRVTNRLDRAYAQFSHRDVELLAGKQVIPVGVGHLFSVVSQSPNHPFLMVDPEYRNTEDAVSLIWSPYHTVEARWLPKAKGQSRDNFHFRGKGTFRGVDMAATLGQSNDKAYCALEGAGNWEEALVRGELAAYAYDGEVVFQGLVGLDQVFSEQWRGEFEVFYNGFGFSDSTQYQIGANPHRSTPHLGRWYFGSKVVWDIGALFSTDFYFIVNLNDPSALLHLRFRYEVTSNMDLLVGQYLGISSSGRSEFGGELPVFMGTTVGIPDMTYLAIRLYF